MFAPRIILIWEHAFLRDSVNVLLEDAGLELLAALDAPPSLETIQTLAPSHILVETSGAKHQELMATLLDQQGLTIIQISIDDNQLQVFQRQDYAIDRSSDLLDLLQSQS